jgi:uncharacterized protein
MKYFGYLFILLIIAGLGFLLQKSYGRRVYDYKTTVLNIGGEDFNTEIADTADLQTLGLSYRKSISKNSAMLFVFADSGVYSFWMKDMNFPIDIIWLDSDKTITYIEKNLSPSTYPQTFGPTTPSKYVLEVAPGTADRLGVHVGNKLFFKDL